VEFITVAGNWVANFQPGLGGVDLAQLHPNQRDAVVLAAGDLWVVNPIQRSAECLLQGIDAAIEVQGPDGWVFSFRGLALARFGPDGIVWHTRRLSWDGFDKLSIAHAQLTGFAWSATDTRWHLFRVDLATGRSTGGSYSGADTNGWEQLAE
jgi:hypothetical protein